MAVEHKDNTNRLTPDFLQIAGKTHDLAYRFFEENFREHKRFGGAQYHEVRDFLSQKIQIIVACLSNLPAAQEKNYANNIRRLNNILGAFDDITGAFYASEINPIVRNFLNDDVIKKFRRIATQYLARNKVAAAICDAPPRQKS